MNANINQDPYTEGAICTSLRFTGHAHCASMWPWATAQCPAGLQQQPTRPRPGPASCGWQSSAAHEHAKDPVSLVQAPSRELQTSKAQLALINKSARPTPARSLYPHLHAHAHSEAVALAPRHAASLKGQPSKQGRHAGC